MYTSRRTLVPPLVGLFPTLQTPLKFLLSLSKMYSKKNWVGHPCFDSLVSANYYESVTPNYNNNPKFEKDSDYRILNNYHGRLGATFMYIRTKKGK